MRDAIPHRVWVPGATIHFTTVGSGPPLLVLQGGPHDADGAEELAQELSDVFTVIRIDRRGQARSPKDDPHAPVTVGQHADDALAVLAEAATEPAIVFGSSIGARIGLEMLLRDPTRIHLLIAHEPPLPEMMAEPERAQLIGFQLDLEETARRDGPLAAMRMFTTALGVDRTDREPGLSPPVPRPEAFGNLDSFLVFDAPAVRTHHLDASRLGAHSRSIVAAVGDHSRRTMHGAGGVALAAALDIDVVDMPGGHGGYATHPASFAARLCELAATHG